MAVSSCCAILNNHVPSPAPCSGLGPALVQASLPGARALGEHLLLLAPAAPISSPTAAHNPQPWGLSEALFPPSTTVERNHKCVSLQMLMSGEVSMTAPYNDILKSDNNELSPPQLFSSPKPLFKKHINYHSYYSTLTSLRNVI